MRYAFKRADITFRHLSANHFPQMNDEGMVFTILTKAPRKISFERPPQKLVGGIGTDEAEPAARGCVLSVAPKVKLPSSERLSAAHSTHNTSRTLWLLA